MINTENRRHEASVFPLSKVIDHFEEVIDQFHNFIDHSEGLIGHFHNYIGHFSKVIVISGPLARLG